MTATSRLILFALAVLASTTGVAQAQHPMAAAAAARGGEAQAEAATGLPEKLTRGEVRDLVSRLSDDDVRALLIAQLDKAALADDAAADEASAVDELMVAGDRARDRLRAILAAAPDTGRAIGAAWQSLTANGDTSTGRLLLALLLALVASVVSERVFLRLTGSFASPPPADATPGVMGRCGLLAVRAVCDLMAIGVGVIAAAGLVFLLLSGNEVAPLALVRIFATVAVIRGIASVSRAILSPNASWLRALPISDAVSAGVHARIVTFAALWELTDLPRNLLEQLQSDALVAALVGLAMSAVLILGLIVMVLRGRAPMAAYIRGESHEGETPDRLIETLASRWHVLAVAYLIGLWVLAVGIRLGTGEEVSGEAIASLLLLVGLPVADGALRALCAVVFKPKPADGADTHEEAHTEEVASDARSRTFELAMLRNVRIMMALVFVLLFASIWDLDLQSTAETLVGGRLASSLFEIVVTLILAYAVWSLVKAAVERVVGDEVGGSGDDDGEHEIGGPGASRVATLLPLLRKVVFISLIVMVALIVLSALGVNIGPLIAGAGVIGLAVGFGAQTLVKDVISGFFFLLDDAFRMGEYVEVDAIRGSVERISVRSLQLRHHNGPVHTLPFGDIRHITNYSRDWAIMKFEIRLPFDTDINKVRKIIKGVGTEMIENEAFKEVMLQPLKSQGVNRMDDSALIVRCKFTSKPGEQFVLRREAYTRIQEALAAQGINFAARRVIVETSDGSRPTPEQIQAAADHTDTVPPAGQRA